MTETAFTLDLPIAEGTLLPPDVAARVQRAALLAKRVPEPLRIKRVIAWRVANDQCQWHELRSSVVVGRSPTCDVIIADESVSREHARFIVEDDEVFLVDLKSKNGTIRNGRRLNGGKVRLNGGDLLYFGSVEVVFLSGFEGLGLG